MCRWIPSLEHQAHRLKARIQTPIFHHRLNMPYCRGAVREIQPSVQSHNQLTFESLSPGRLTAAGQWRRRFLDFCSFWPI